jgi:hypothetical protein
MRPFTRLSLQIVVGGAGSKNVNCCDVYSLRCSLKAVPLPWIRILFNTSSEWSFLRRMPSSGMLRHVALVRTDVSEERSFSIIKETRMGKLGTTLAVTSNRRSMPRLLDTTNVVCSSRILVLPDGRATFLRNICSYKSHTASHLRRRHSS